MTIAEMIRAEAKGSRTLDEDFFLRTLSPEVVSSQCKPVTLLSTDVMVINELYKIIVEMTMFIALDGAEGTGKTTQAKILSGLLREWGKLVLEVREPGSTFVGEQIRSVLLDVKNQDIDWRTESLLFFASRAELYHKIIRPHLESAKDAVVICDRFIGSTYAYQQSLALHDLWNLTSLACGSNFDFKCFVLDMPVEKRRLKPIKDRIEQKSEQYHEDVRNRYRILCSAAPERFIQVPVEDLSIEQVTQELVKRLFA